MYAKRQEIYAVNLYIDQSELNSFWKNDCIPRLCCKTTKFSMRTAKVDRAMSQFITEINTNRLLIMYQEMQPEKICRHPFEQITETLK